MAYGIKDKDPTMSGVAPERGKIDRSNCAKKDLL